ncbi:MAG: hypothetical protein GTO12_02935 [Proteobacteria bacterium]|nr:hypothetical protein [Pseudomonadota bacterium]
MSDKLEKELQSILGLTLVAKEDNEKYVLTKDQLQALLDDYRKLLGLLSTLLDQRQRLEYLLVEHRLENLGIVIVEDYLN